MSPLRGGIRRGGFHIRPHYSSLCFAIVYPARSPGQLHDTPMRYGTARPEACSGHSAGVPAGLCGGGVG